MEATSAMQSRKLSPEQQSFYADNGYFSPCPVLSGAEVTEFEGRFLDYFANYAPELCALLQRDRRVYMSETHLCLNWVYRMVSHPAVLDAVESVLGPNIIVWATQWFPKVPGEGAYVSWHQDDTYWGLHPPNVTTAWIALSDSTPENGCMRVVPGTQHKLKLPQRETYAPNNMLSRGQEIAVEVDEAQAVDLVLQPGEMSLHHIGIVHGSGKNTSDHARIGLAVRYTTPDVVQSGAARDITLLVRGKDEYGHFDFVEPPTHDTRPEDSALHQEALRKKAVNMLPANHPAAR